VASPLFSPSRDEFVLTTLIENATMEKATIGEAAKCSSCFSWLKKFLSEKKKKKF
jgi:hypothetical protein